MLTEWQRRETLLRSFVGRGEERKQEGKRKGNERDDRENWEHEESSSVGGEGSCSVVIYDCQFAPKVGKKFCRNFPT